ncbi:hypothetical protein LXA43DRAFT_670343 [Ganoderma leucocontextum]|nr:hypothetical protein LXA43DRAFT_670343 [Ganoderma leucocontextum]
MTGLLFVYSEPGSAVSAEQFNDWYDNEHVPLRIRIPGFHSWSRWISTDGKQPSYLAIYDIDSTSTVNEPPYSSLADTRSDREKNIIDRVALLDRRAYSVHEPVHPPKAGDAYDVRKPGPYMSSVAMDIPDEHVAEFHKWYDEEHIPLFSKIPGWVRTRRFVFEEGAARGTEESLKPEGGRPQTFIALHEWETPDAVGSEEYKAAVSTPWTLKFKGIAARFEPRVFKLWRSWDRE